MSRVAPFASVKSVSAHIVLHTVGGWGFGQRDELIVGVDRLRRLARADRDRRERRDEQPGVEHAARRWAARRVDRDRSNSGP